LRQLNYPDYLTIVIDNGSSDDSVQNIKMWAKEKMGEDHVLVEYTRLTALGGGEGYDEKALERVSAKTKLVLIINEENLGFTGGNNVAIHYALHKRYPAEYVFLLNNDAKVEKDCLMNLVSVARRADAGIVGAVLKDEKTGEILEIPGRPDATFPLIRQFFRPIVRWPISSPTSKDDFWTCSWAGGAAMLIWGDALRAVYESMQRYFDNRLFLYGEDFEFCHIASKKGFRTVVTKNAAIFHKAFGSSGGRYNPLAYYYLNRNQILLANWLLPIPWKMIHPLVNIPLCLTRALKNIMYSRPKSARAVLRGVVDGYTGVIGKWKHHDREVMRSDAV
jgi:GT2 family glycosyltransferase